jgi:hypothetical protein
MRRLLVPLMLLLSVAGCSEKIKHDETLAGTQAVEFARMAIVQQDFERSYQLLSDAAKRYVPLDKFKQALIRMHPNNHPIKIKATEYEPMPGEKAIYIYLVGDNSGEAFYYTLTMEGTAATGYKVSKFTAGNRSFLPSTNERKPFQPPIGD